MLAVRRLLGGSMGVREFSERFWRKTMPHAAVRRRVQGVDLVLPRLHRLPEYAERYPAYGQCLVELAAGLADDGPFTMIDVGANIGDSALQVLKAAPGATVVCVEGDPEWVPWLERNVGADDRVQVVPALLAAGADDMTGLGAVRHRGTTRFVPGGDASGVRQVAVGDLPEHHRGSSPVRLLKSDTDGHDTRLVPALAVAYADTLPVLFLEYDEGLSRLSGDATPEDVVDRLATLGYRTFAVWDNLGEVRGSFGADDWVAARALMHQQIESGAYHFWDIAAAHDDDPAGSALLARLAPEPLRR